MNIETVAGKFIELFGIEDGPITTCFAPGRVNLIGEHTDYNGGHVFPCALTLGIYGAIRARADRTLRLYSLNFEEGGVVTDSIDNLTPGSDSGWASYMKGIVWTLKSRGYSIEHGFDCVIGGDIPAGSGLSSSAALEVLTGCMLREIFGFSDLTNQDLALIGQYSENNYNGLNCGIMDQFASAMGKKDHAIFLDTATLKFEYAPLFLENASILITNSKVKHSLVSSAYNDRREECARALKRLSAVTHIETLGDMTPDQFESYKDVLMDPIILKRARHAIYENQRTVQAMSALRSNNIAHFGKLMNASHISLRDDYEVSCPEIDLLVDLAWAHDGVIGSRITGGGFGGCTVSIVKNEAIPSFIEEIGAAYHEKTGLTAEFYTVQAGEGAHVIH